ncbi:MAG: hypothetical protein HY259_08635 [Chloroflexi bacterium]|nr:hypothetical protein [Chloroflexota bacterium]
MNLLIPDIASALPLQQDCSGVAITSPRASNDPVRGRVVISGSAAIANFQFYKVEFAEGTNPPDSGFHSIAPEVRRTQVRAGQLEIWDTLAIPDGPYTLKLTVVDITANFPCPPVLVRPVIVGNRAPTPTPTGTPTETPAPTPTRRITVTLSAPTVAVPTSAARTGITSTTSISDTAAPRSLIDFGFLGGVSQALTVGACGMGSLIGLIGLFALGRWVLDQI